VRLFLRCYFTAYSAGGSRSPASVTTSPPLANQHLSAVGAEFRGGHSLSHLMGLDTRIIGVDGAASYTDEHAVPAQEGDSSAHRHAELLQNTFRVIKCCHDAQLSIEGLVSHAGTLLVKRQHPHRMPGGSTRTTVGLMLNCCAIDNVLPAMALHADLLKGDIIVKVDDQPVTTETVHKQLIGEDIPGTSVMLTVRRGHTERTAQLIRMANSDIFDMRRVFEIFTNLKSRFPVISGEVDEVVTIWSEVVSGDALYRAQVANSTQRLQREGAIHMQDLKTGLEELHRTNNLVADAFDDARAIETRLNDVKQQLIQFGKEVCEPRTLSLSPYHALSLSRTHTHTYTRRFVSSFQCRVRL